ncbi:serine hydrolase domain-containing protein [Silvanigrella aquatica]|uniref:serine hydrolase domain-containing protein n=1 Tax=Silvanigrella aquatica TaxID=1915309 RepID=UPI001E388B07|nr:serine hydrolase domain-containing protein [Silvanigrella aquatica]
MKKIFDDYYFQFKDIEYFSAVSFTMQCNGFNNSLPITFQNGYKINSNSFSSDEKINLRSIFQIGSLTKSIISILLLQIMNDPLYKDKNISLEDGIEKWININDFPSLYPWRNVTLLQLLNMTSGIPDYLKNSKFLDTLINNPDKHFSKSELFSFIDGNNYISESNFEYSNSNYLILGVIIENITKNSLENEVYNRIIKNYNIHSTFFPSHFPDQNLNINLVNGYYYDFNSLILPLKTNISNYSLSYANSAGGMLSTTEDFNYFIQNVFNSKSIYLKKFLIDMAVEIERDHDFSEFYSMGFGIKKDLKNEELSFKHTGMTLGFRSMFTYNPDYNLSMVIFVNSSIDNENIEKLIHFLNEEIYSRNYCKKL